MGIVHLWQPTDSYNSATMRAYLCIFGLMCALLAIVAAQPVQNEESMLEPQRRPSFVQQRIARSPKDKDDKKDKDEDKEKDDDKDDDDKDKEDDDDDDDDKDKDDDDDDDKDKDDKDKDDKKDDK